MFFKGILSIFQYVNSAIYLVNGKWMRNKLLHVSVFLHPYISSDWSSYSWKLFDPFQCWIFKWTCPALLLEEFIANFFNISIEPDQMMHVWKLAWLYTGDTGFINSVEAVKGLKLFNPFPHTANLQQITFKTSRQKNGKPQLMKVHVLWLKKNEIILTKGEIAHFEQFLLLSKCFQKVVFCKCIKMCL